MVVIIIFLLFFHSVPSTLSTNAFFSAATKNFNGKNLQRNFLTRKVNLHINKANFCKILRN